MVNDLDGIAYFVALAETRGFRAAGRQLGVSGSAVSHALRRLEERLGVLLVHRTTRSVRLTEAGERLYEAARNAMSELRTAAVAVRELGDLPGGHVRLIVAPAAQAFLSGPMLAGFLIEHPNIRLELFISDESLDIVEEGFDAGIRLGEVIDQDMVAVAVSSPQRMLVVGTPGYFERHGKPRHPRDLAKHECINWHPTADAPPYRWVFTEEGRTFHIDVPTRVLTNDPVFNLRLVKEGIGLTMRLEDRIRDEIAAGSLVTVLEEFASPFPGYYMYYPRRQNASGPLRALIEYVRARATAPA